MTSENERDIEVTGGLLKIRLAYRDFKPKFYIVETQKSFEFNLKKMKRKFKLTQK